MSDSAALTMACDEGDPAYPDRYWCGAALGVSVAMAAVVCLAVAIGAEPSGNLVFESSVLLLLPTVCCAALVPCWAWRCRQGSGASMPCLVGIVAFVYQALCGSLWLAGALAAPRWVVVLHQVASAVLCGTVRHLYLDHLGHLGYFGNLPAPMLAPTDVLLLSEMPTSVPLAIL